MECRVIQYAHDVNHATTEGGESMRFNKNQAPHDRIRILRVAKRITQAALAEMLGRDQQAVSDWENGKHDVSDLYRTRLAKALDVEPKDIWG